MTSLPTCERCCRARRPLTDPPRRPAGPRLKQRPKLSDHLGGRSNRSMTQTAGSGQPIESTQLAAFLPRRRHAAPPRAAARPDRLPAERRAGCLRCGDDDGLMNGSDVIGARPVLLRPRRPSQADRAPFQPMFDAGVDGVSSWAGTDRGGLVRYETERTALLGGRRSTGWTTTGRPTCPAGASTSSKATTALPATRGATRPASRCSSRPTASSADVARILAHELGHAVDVTLTTGDERSGAAGQRERRRSVVAVERR
ncbi:MAG: hypothetical protein R2710_19745 [Acidimicrobiales bacterium]